MIHRGPPATGPDPHAIVGDSKRKLNVEAERFVKIESVAMRQ